MFLKELIKYLFNLLNLYFSQFRRKVAEKIEF